MREHLLRTNNLHFPAKIKLLNRRPYPDDKTFEHHSIALLKTRTLPLLFLPSIPHVTMSEKEEGSATMATEAVLADNPPDTPVGADVHWWQQPNLRNLYLLMPFLFLGSTTLGYDGSLVNGLQTMPSWQECLSPPNGCLVPN